MPLSVCVFSPVTKTSPVDQQDFELLAQCRINRVALCVSLHVFESMQAHYGVLPDVNYAELIFTQGLYAMLCWVSYRRTLMGQGWKSAFSLFQVDVNCMTMFRVAITDSTTILPQTAIFTLSPSVWKHSHSYSRKCV